MSSISSPMSQDQPDLIPVVLSSFRRGSVTGFKLYIRTAPDSEPVLFSDGHQPVSEDLFDRLGAMHHKHVYIESTDTLVYRRYVEENLGAILHDPELPTVTKSEVMYNTATALMQDAMEDPRSGNLVE